MPSVSQMPGLENAPSQAAVEPALEREYIKMHTNCSNILNESFRDGRNLEQARSHQFLYSLQKWAKISSERPESYLLETAAREYNYALLALTQGHYRQAFKGLRLVLELEMQAVYLSVHILKLKEWLDADRTERTDTSWKELVDQKDGVLSVRYAQAFFPELEPHVLQFNGLAGKLYRECSECIHGNVPRHISLPESFVFDSQTFKLWHEKADTMALIVSFLLTLRYAKDMEPKKLSQMDSDIREKVGHLSEIRNFLDAALGESHG